MPGYVAVVLTTYLFFLVVLKRRAGLLSPTGLFGLTSVLMAVGTFVQIDERYAVESTYADIVLYCTMAFLLTSLALAQVSKERGTAVRVVEHRPGIALYALLALTIVIVVLYFRAVGYSAFIAGLRNLGTGSSLDVGGLRLESYSGSRYLFPGYVNQFKNALLPALTIVVALHLRDRPGPRLVFLPLLILFCIFALVGAGQRGAFIIAVVMLLAFAAMWARGREVSLGTLAAGTVAVGAVLTLTTVALGRNTTLSHDASWFDRTWTSLRDFADRILLINQRAGIEGFRYTESLPRPGFGAEWVQSLTGILPGNRGSDLARQIFAMRYGSNRGTSPPSLWGSVHYNFGMIGVIVVPILLAWVCAVISSAALRRQRKNALEAVGIAGVTASLGMWVADSPLFLLNVGIVTYAALWWAGARLGAPEETVPEATRGRGLRTPRSTLRRGRPAGRRPSRLRQPVPRAQRPRSPLNSR